MYIDSIVSEYLDSPQIDPSQLSDFLTMVEDYNSQLPQQEILFCQSLLKDDSTINVLPF
jgi:hypothetical protein